MGTQQLVTMLKRERAAGFKRLGGTQIEASLPITQRLIDVLLRQVASERRLSGLEVTLKANQEIGVVVVKPVLGFETRLGIDLRIRGPVDLASDPHVYLVLARPSMTWSALSRVAIAAGLAPEGIEIGRDGVAINLRAMAARAGAPDLLSLLRTVRFDGEPGVLWVHVRGDVPEKGAAGIGGPGVQEEGSSRRPPAAQTRPDPELLLTEMRGARVKGRIAVSQELANEAVGLALGAAREIGSPPVQAPIAGSRRAPAVRLDAATIAGWIRRANVLFENGRFVLEAEVVIG